MIPIRNKNRIFNTFFFHINQSATNVTFQVYENFVIALYSVSMYILKFLFKSILTTHFEALFLHFAFDPGYEFRYFGVNCKPLQNLLFHTDLQSLQFQLGSKQGNLLKGIDNYFTQAHCSYLNIYISRKIRVCLVNLEDQFQTNLQANV